MIPYGSDTNIPSNWRICDGAEISRETYADLFNIIGTSYGEGDGVTTFNLPNKRGRVSVGLDEEQEEFNSIGLKGGEKEHTLTIDEIPSHSHAVKGTTGAGNYAEGVSFGNSPNPPYTSNVGMTGGGGNKPHNNLQPYEVDVWIIKVSNLVSSLEETTGTIIDNLTSTSTTDALSSNMGRELNEKINKMGLGVTLYNNESGSYDTITLNDSIENYNFVEIYYIGKFEDSGDSYCYTKMFNPSGKRIELMSNTPKSQANAINLHALITISGTSLTWLKNYMCYVGNGGYSGATTNCIRIVKIVGLK